MRANTELRSAVDRIDPPEDSKRVTQRAPCVEAIWGTSTQRGPSSQVSYHPPEPRIVRPLADRRPPCRHSTHKCHNYVAPAPSTRRTEAVSRSISPSLITKAGVKQTIRP